MNSKLQTILESIRTSFWLVPSLMVCCATLMASVLLIIDGAYQTSNSEMLQYFYQISPESIRAILTTIATSMITITSIAFSITVVALTLASSQFGPRLIRNFMSDQGTQFVLGMFVAIFVYCLLILQAIKSTDQSDFIPGLSVYVAIALAFVGVGVLIYFIHHVAHSIQADNVIEQVYCQLQSNIARLFPDDSNSRPTQQSNPDKLDDLFQGQSEIRALSDGYVQTVNIDKLLELGSDYDMGFEVVVAAGDFITKDATIMSVFYQQDKPAPEHSVILNNVVLGAKRTPIQDPEFAIHQLVEIAVRALSPGINDPYTAISCVDKLSAMLCKLTQRQFPASAYYDDEDKLRLISRAFTFSGLGQAAFNQIRQYAKDSIAVTIRLVEGLESISIQAQTKEHSDFVFDQSKAIAEVLNQSSMSSRDRDDISKRLERISQKKSRN